MKSTKRILSAILSVVMILGCLTVGFTAQASAQDLVDKVAAGGDVNWTGGNVTLADTLVINKDVNIDFNGAVITGPAGKVAIRVDGGEVTLYDGVILADQGSYSGETGFVKALMNYKPAISINDGNVELNCITAVGSLLRIPNSGTIEVPIGNGINANDGTVVLDNVIAIGMKALDNTKADVTVKDAILAGIYKAVNIYSAVDFGANYEQYETVELLEGFLKDGVNLSANEKKYIASATNSQGDFSVGSVIVNVAKPAFNAPTTTYVEDKLNVFAVVEEHEHYGVSNRYSYTYTPDYAVIGDDKQDFAADGAQYVASFDGLTAGEEYDVTVNYDLSIKLGKKQKEIVEKAFSILEHYIDKAPELLNRFVVDFEHIYNTAENLVALVYNAYFGNETDLDRLAQAELKKIEGIKDIIAIIYALEGLEYKGSAGDVKDDSGLSGYAGTIAQIYNAVQSIEAGAANAETAKTYLMNNYGTTDLEGAVRAYYAQMNNAFMSDYKFDWDGDGVADSVFAYTYDDVEYDISVNDNRSKPGYGSGKGLLDEFDKYYNGILDALYAEDSTTEFAENGVENAAAYIGYNWEGIYKLVKNAVVILDKANELLDGGAFESVLNIIGKGSFASYISAFDTAYKYVNKIMDRADEALDSQFVATYLKDADTAAKYCGRYAKKVWNIANNPETYFDITVPTGTDYVVVDLLDDNLNKTFTVTAEEQVKDVYVKVDIAGYGAAEINGVRVNSTSDAVWFKYGESIEVKPIVKAEGSNYSYMTVDTNGNHTVVDGEVFTAKAATNLDITVVFTAEETDTQVVFMTDKALNYKYLGGQYFDAETWTDDVLDVEAPKFEGLTQKGWALKKDAETGAALATLGSAVADAAKTNDVVVVYAIYEYDEQVEVKPQDEVIKMTDYKVVDGKGYFEVNIQLKGAKAIEAGVILTMTKEFATETTMTTALAGKAGVIFSRTSKVDENGYVNQNVQYTAGVTASGTVYARGYVVYPDGTADYTEIVSLDL